MSWLKIEGCTGSALARRILLAVAMGWVPPFALAFFAGHPPSVSITIFTDLSFHVRYWVAIPILLAAECHVTKHLTWVIPILRERDLLPGDFAALRAKLKSLREHALPEALILVASLIYVGSQAYFEVSKQIPTWRQIPGPAIQLAVGWDQWVGLTLYYFLILRWIWRFLIWCWFLFRLAKAKPPLQSHHPDRAGGLGFLVHRHLRFALAAMAVSSVISGKIALSVVYAGLKLESFLFPVLLYLGIVEFVVALPLLIFTPQLIHARLSGLDEFGTFANHYAGRFDQKWVHSGAIRKLDPLGTPDLQSLSDLSGSYGQQVEMKPLLMGYAHFLVLTALIALPLFPLILFEIPLHQLLQTLLGLIGVGH